MRRREGANRALQDEWRERLQDDLVTLVELRARAEAHDLDTTPLYEELLKSLGGDQVVLRLEPRFLDPAPDDALESRLEGAFPDASVELVPSHESDLLQLGDLLTGSVRGDMARTAKGRSNPRGGSTADNVKDRLIASLKDRLGVQRLARPSLAERDDFRVRVLRPPF